jgi:hypothetical protein
MLQQVLVYWLRGTWKTTIAYTVAKACHENEILGPSFFRLRDDVASSNSKLNSTIAAMHLEMKSLVL